MNATSRTVLAIGDILQIPVGLCKATSSTGVKLVQLTPDGERKPQQFYKDPETGDEVARGVMRRGVEVSAERYVTVDPAELKRIDDDHKLDEVELLEFIDYRRVPTDRLQGSYWVQPDPGFARPLAKLIAAMRRSQKAAVVKFTMRTGQTLGVIRVRSHDGVDVLLLNTLAFADEWRSPDEDVLATAEVETDEDDRSVAAALELIEALSGPGASLEKARDESIAPKRELVERATTSALTDDEGDEAEAPVDAEAVAS